MNNIERVDFYLGNIINLDKSDITLKSNINLLQDNPYYDHNLKNLLIKTNNDKKKFNFVRHDNWVYQQPTCFLKSRGRDFPNDGVILRCLNFKRHWENYYNKPKDMKFDKKLN